MLYVFGFERFGVVVGDLYFDDPAPKKGQEGAERGVRLEVRELERGELKGSIYSAQPIGVDRPIWRADLLESVAGEPGSFDRTHHHPTFNDWSPGPRVFDRGLSANPVEWVGERLADLDGLLALNGSTDSAGDDAVRMREQVPEILEVVRRLLTKVMAGELGRQPADDPTAFRVGWL